MTYFRKNWFIILVVTAFYITFDGGIMWGSVYFPRMYSHTFSDYITVFGFIIPTNYIPKLLIFEIFSLCFYTASIMITNNVSKISKRALIKQKYDTKHWFGMSKTTVYRDLSQKDGAIAGVILFWLWFTLVNSFFH